LPRQIDIDKLPDEEIRDIVITANLTPRNCRGFKTTFQAILKELGKDVQIRFASRLRGTAGQGERRPHHLRKCWEPLSSNRKRLNLHVIFASWHAVSTFGSDVRDYRLSDCLAD
jgi:hypothetical protein